MLRVRYLLSKGYYFLWGGIVARFLYDKKYLKTSHFANPSSRGWEWAVYDFYGRRHTGKNRNCPWPVSPYSDVPHPENIVFEPEDLRMFIGTGIYFQGIYAKTYFGKNCWIARNVGFITSNHELVDPDKHQKGMDIRIGDNCWIGMNAVILPGVTLGDHTVVGAGAVVTKSFPDGYCVLAGNPAGVLRRTTAKQEDGERVNG